MGGITVGVLMLPIGMGYGVIAGQGPVAGLYGAIAVTFFAALFGGTRGLISGPSIFVAVAMAVIVAEYTTTLAEALTAVILAGLLQIAFGVLSFGRYASYTPYSMLAGFFTAAGILLIGVQSIPALGWEPVGGGFIGHIQALPAAVADVNYQAFALAIGTVVLGFVWRGRVSRLVPAPFVVLVAGTAPVAQLLGAIDRCSSDRRNPVRATPVTCASAHPGAVPADSPTRVHDGLAECGGDLDRRPLRRLGDWEPPQTQS